MDNSAGFVYAAQAQKPTSIEETRLQGIAAETDLLRGRIYAINDRLRVTASRATGASDNNLVGHTSSTDAPSRPGTMGMIEDTIANANSWLDELESCVSHLERSL